MPYPPKPTTADVQAMREQTEMGLYHARRVVMNRWRCHTLTQLRAEMDPEDDQARALLDVLLSLDECKEIGR